MLYKNTFRLMFSNANLIWKVAIFIIISILAVAGLSFVVALPILQILVNENFFALTGNIYQAFLDSFDLKTFIVQVGDLSIRLTQILTDNIKEVVFSLFGFGVVFLILGSIMLKMYAMPTCVTLNYYMGSNTKHGFMNSFASSFKKNFLYQLLSLVIFLPLNLGGYYLLLYSFRLFKLGGIFLIISPFIILFGFSIFMALKHTFLCGWMPSVVIKNKGVWAGLKDSMVIVKRRFWQTFGNAFSLVLTVIFMNMFGGIFTYGVGLIITLPVSILLYQIFGMVAYYSASGQKYYLDPYNVMAPKTMEHTDKLSNQKYIV